MKTKVAMVLALAAFAVLCVPMAHAASDPYSKVVENLETQYHAKRKHIPLLGVGNFVLKFWHPAGVKNVQVAVFDDAELYGETKGNHFDSVVKAAAGGQWRPVVREFSRKDNQWVYIYYSGEGKDAKVLVVSLDPKDAIVAQVKFDPMKLAEFIENPQILGHSLINNIHSEMDNPGTVADAQPATESDRQPDAQQVNTDATSASSDRPKEAPVLHKPETAAEPGYREDPSSAPPAEIHAAGKEAAETEKPIKLEARLVNLNISALNHAGVAVPNLTKEDFSVFENGIEQHITFFETNDSRVNLMLLLDLSSSTRNKIKLMKTAASRFIDSLPSADRIGVAAFTRRYYLISDFTSDHALLKDRIERMKNLEGGTAFYDALWTAMAGLDRPGDSRKALVVLSDGVDENLLDSQLHPSKHTFQEMLERVSEDDVTVYPIYLDTEWDEVKQSGPRAHDAYTTARSQLYQVADSTGGTVIKAVVDEDLDGAYQKVAAELHSLYSLAYAPKDLKNNGRWRQIHVKTGRKDVVLRTRRGFYDK
jgi:VWFA-related protein